MTDRADAVRSLLRDTTLLSALPDKLLGEIAARAVERRYARGDWVLRDGDLSNSMYIVLQGEVHIIKHVRGQELLLDRFGPGQPFGEMALIDDSPRSAHVRAASDELTVLEFSRDDVLSLLLSHPRALYEAVRLLNARLRAADADRFRELEQKIDELSDLNRRLQYSYDATLSALSHALDLRDQATEGHSQRVTAYSLLIGEALALDAVALDALRLGALLHDIGKIGVSDAILRKPGRLTEEEVQQMRFHPAWGRLIIEEIEFLQCAIDVVFCHHERWDGAGYPRGLRGEAIPLGARIFAVADVFDALTMERSYKGAWTADAAREQIVRESGTHFDPRVVEAFVRVLPQLVEVMTRSKQAVIEAEHAEPLV